MQGRDKPHQCVTYDRIKRRTIEYRTTVWIIITISPRLFTRTTTHNHSGLRLQLAITDVPRQNYLSSGCRADRNHWKHLAGPGLVVVSNCIHSIMNTFEKHMHGIKAGVMRIRRTSQSLENQKQTNTSKRHTSKIWKIQEKWYTIYLLS